VVAGAEARLMLFQHPEAFLVLPLAALLLRRRLWPRPLVGALRVLVLTAVATALAGPWWPGPDDGRDVVLVLDRSASMSATALDEAKELAAQLAARLQPGDRIGVVAFGRKPAVERVPTAPFSWPDLARPVDADASDLGAAVAAGLALVPPGRQGSLLVVSDGEATGGDLDGAARAAARAGVRIDTVCITTAPGGDVAVADVYAPGEVAVGEPFALSAVVTAPAAGPAAWRLLADGEVVREGTAELRAGRNVLQFRRALPSAGLHEFAVEVVFAGDTEPRNDRGRTVVRGTAPLRVLCVTPGGREDRLSRSLRAQGLEVVVAAPASAPLTAAGLDAVRCVVLEDVPAAALAPGAMATLASWVRDLGGGLLMTGGASSFGVGGWHRTPVEDVLPVTMEMREEQRRFGLAMAIALDRSGSMSVDAGGVTKMQLADRGAAAAVEMLTRLDAVAVLAVDTGPHVVVEMQPVVDAQAIGERIRSIESQGGGIFVGAALHAAAEQLARSTQQNRHIVLFADADDAEEPGDYLTFVPDLVRAGVTLSVIGLGTPAGTDAALLEELARLGNGRCHFVAEAADLPRVFAQETIQVARSAMIEEPTAVEVQPSFATLGDLPAAFPGLGGYALAWRRPRAELDLLTLDAQKAPLLTHWQHGLGRSAAFLGELDGALTGDLGTWDQFGGCFATLVRWLGGGQTPGVFVQARREGDTGFVVVEAEAAQAAALDTARGVLTTPDGAVRDLGFERLGDGRLQARVPLQTVGLYRAAVQVAGETVRVAPLVLPYSPEFAPRHDARDGERRLRQLARTTGGHVQPSVTQVLAGERRSAGRVDLGPFAVLAAFALLFVEIVVRRFGLELPALRVPAVRRRPRTAAPAAASEAPAAPVEPPPPAPAADAPQVLLDALSRAKRRTEGR
jgi:uncharacterized membrane protein